MTEVGEKVANIISSRCFRAILIHTNDIDKNGGNCKLAPNHQCVEILCLRTGWTVVHLQETQFSDPN